MKPKFLIIALLVCCINCKADTALTINELAHESNKQTIPVGGNSWINNGGKIDTKGLSEWSNVQSVCQTYFKVAQPGKLILSLLLNPNGSKSKINVNISGKIVEVVAEGDVEQEYLVGEWDIPQKGYVKVEIQGVSKTGATFGTLSGITVSGAAITTDLAFVKNNEDNFFYWGRRGPSVHLNYLTDGIENVEWFYNEVTVPVASDVIGSYFMANGFGEGYFGMQVNSEKERRILFSVWSPFTTDNPASIPQDQRILLTKKGTDVYSGEFGNEGSGGQSYLKYNWKAGNTYKFLLNGKPAADNYTTYTAYFFAPEENQWRLIASFKRPKTSTYLKGLHSFLENFTTETGNQVRTVNFDNQWIYNTKNSWTELSQVRFTGDNTARKGYRLDYGGGETNGIFYLKNCGFFSENTTLDSKFSRTPKGKAPSIDFSKLP